MSKELMIELFGYLGSLLVLISFITTSVVKLRIINTIGSIIFSIYAIIIKSYPTAVMNAALVGINIHYLIKMMKVGKEYEVIKVKNDETIVSYFIDHHKEDLDKFFNESDVSGCNLVYMPMCEGKPVGLTAGNLNGDTFELKMDYTTKEYRDFSIGDRVFWEMRKDGIRNVIFDCDTKNFEDYLKKFDFVFKDGRYEKSLEI